MLVGADGSTYKAGNTGGSSSVTLSSSNLPSHTHGISHTHTTPASTTGIQSTNHVHAFSTGTGITSSNGWIYYGGTSSIIAGTHDIVASSGNGNIAARTYNGG